MRPELLRWQWEGYPRFHQDLTNLWLHLFAVPVFVAAAISFVVNLVLTQWLAALGSFVALVLAFGLQGVGHKREQNAAIPFDGPGDAVARIFAEQFLTFPRFLLSGAWHTAYRRARGGRE